MDNTAKICLIGKRMINRSKGNRSYCLPCTLGCRSWVGTRCPCRLGLSWWVAPTRHSQGRPHTWGWGSWVAPTRHPPPHPSPLAAQPLQATHIHTHTAQLIQGNHITATSALHFTAISGVLSQRQHKFLLHVQSASVVHASAIGSSIVQCGFVQKQYDEYLEIRGPTDTFVFAKMQDMRLSLTLIKHWLQGRGPGGHLGRQSPRARHLANPQASQLPHQAFPWVHPHPSHRACWPLGQQFCR